jgi:hypothetical protein
VLRPETKDEAIYCYDERGPHFHDIDVADKCNANANSFTDDFGSSYTNSTGMERRTFFTGAGRFRVKEIEVFEVSQ